MKELIKELINIVSENENVNPNDILNCRSRESIRCRAIITIILYDKYNMSFKEIGKHLNRDSATIRRIHHYYLTIMSDYEKKYLKKIFNLLLERFH